MGVLDYSHSRAAMQAMARSGTGPNTWTVLLAHEEPLVIEGLRCILSSPEFTVVGSVGDGYALVKAATELRPDLIIASVSLPSLNGIEAARRIHRAGLRLKIILLSQNGDLAFGARALRAGAKGFVLNTSPASDVLQAIRQVLRHKLYVPPAMQQGAAEQFQSLDNKDYELTPRQREILQLLTEGKPPKQIARILNISPRTVEFHKYSMLEKLRLGTSAELIVWAVKQGM